jgi:spoIIIJ-associated protein
MTQQDKADKAKTLIVNALKLLELNEEQVHVDFTDGHFHVQIDLPAEETGVFIGHHGETIQSLQLILSLLVNRRLDEWFPIRLNVGDYHERREENLIKKAEAAAQRALDSGEEVIIPNLNSFERRQIHVHFQDHDLVATESVGDEPNRLLTIVPKSLLKIGS